MANNMLAARVQSLPNSGLYQSWLPGGAGNRPNMGGPTGLMTSGGADSSGLGLGTGGGAADPKSGGFQNPGGGLSYGGPAGGGASPGSGGFQNPGGGLSSSGSIGPSPGDGATLGMGAGGPAGGGVNAGIQQPAFQSNVPSGVLGGPTGYQTLGGNGPAAAYNGINGLRANMNSGAPGYAAPNQPIIGPNGQRLVNNMNATMSGAPPGYAPGMNGQMIPLYGRGNHTANTPGGPLPGSPDSPEGRAAWLAQQQAGTNERAAAQRALWEQQRASPAYQQQLADFYRNNFASGGPFPTTK